MLTLLLHLLLLRLLLLLLLLGGAVERPELGIEGKVPEQSLRSVRWQAISGMSGGKCEQRKHEL